MNGQLAYAAGALTGFISVSAFLLGAVALDRRVALRNARTGGAPASW